MSAEELRAKIREIPDFPKPGILFYDITTLLKDAAAYHEAIDLMLEPYEGERGCGEHTSLFDARGYPGQEPPLLVRAGHLEADDVLARRVRVDVAYDADAGPRSLDGGPEEQTDGCPLLHERDPRARWSCAFVIFERPRMLRSRASSYS